MFWNVVISTRLPLRIKLHALQPEQIFSKLAANTPNCLCLIQPLFFNASNGFQKLSVNMLRMMCEYFDLGLTNRFHFAVRLYSDNAQMTSKRGENKEVRYEL